MDNADRHTLDALDAFLDRTFQGRAADSSALDPSLTECARRLYARDDAPAADPIFLHKLREDLMLTPTPTLTGNDHAYPPSIVVPPRIVKPRPLSPTGKSAVRTLNHWRRRAWPAVELLGAAMLLMGLLAGAFVTYNNGPAALNQPAGSDIAMLGGNPARSGEMPGPGPEGQPGLVWKSQVGINHDLSPGSAPIVANDKVYLVASGLTGFADQFFLVAMDATTGDNLWQIGLEGSAYAAPAVANGKVYVGITIHRLDPGVVVGTPDEVQTDQGYVVAFDASTGAEKWFAETRGSESSSPAVVDGSLFIGSTDGGMYAFGAETGETLWQSDAARVDYDPGNPPIPLSSSTPATDGNLVFVSGTEGAVHALDVASGEERWQVPIPDGGMGMPVVAGDLLLVRELAEKPGMRTVDDTKLTVIDIKTGEVAWTLASPPQDFLSVSASGDLIFVVESNREESLVRALEGSTGDQQWSTEYAATTVESPVIADGHLYLGDQDGYIRSLDKATGDDEWTFRVGGGVASSLAVVDGRIYAHSGQERAIYALGDATANIGTPAATPPVDGDVSGISPCTVESRPEPDIDLPSEGTPISEIFTTPSVTPEASVVAVTELQRQGQPAGMLPEDVPDGPAASESQLAEITSTLEAMLHCNRPGSEGQVAAFYSDDFFRRPWVAVTVTLNGFQFLWAPEDQEALRFEETHVLDDGRVAVLIRYNDIFARLVVFTEQDGRWLIDETVQVGPVPDGRG